MNCKTFNLEEENLCSVRSNLFSGKTVDVAHVLVMCSITLFANYLSLSLLFFLREKEFIASFANSLATLLYFYACFITPGANGNWSFCF